jgi:hypothetical protein
LKTGKITSISTPEGVEAGEDVVELAVVEAFAREVDVMLVSATAMIERSRRVMFAVRTLEHVQFLFDVMLV